MFQHKPAYIQYASPISVFILEIKWEEEFTMFTVRKKQNMLIILSSSYKRKTETFKDEIIQARSWIHDHFVTMTRQLTESEALNNTDV